MRSATESAQVTAAVRAMYKRVGLDPTKTRPSSEALLRRVRRGDGLPRINSLVDVINWCSLETQLPFGLYDQDRIDGAVSVRLGMDGEEYAGIRKDAVHVAGRLVLADARGAFGNPTSDSARTQVTAATARALVVVFVPAGLDDAGARALTLTRERVATFCGCDDAGDVRSDKMST
jgi:DNA/RNA-binding domain of Phe-tRNA-synthetase-like protein